MDEKQLIVEKAYPNDSGRGIARIDPKKFLELDIIPGDIIEIEGKKCTSAKAWRLEMSDWDKDIMRIDGFIRQNADVPIGDHVKIRKAEFKNAEKVVLASPEGTSTQFGEDAEMVKWQIMKRPITKGDIIPVMSTIAHPFLGKVVTGQTILLVAMETEPEGIILIRDGTEIKLKDKTIITEANGRKLERGNSEFVEYLEKLKTGNEMERLWAVAKIEEKCYNNGIPPNVLDCLLRLFENDESVIVRSFVIRALYHQSSENWPYRPEDRKKIFESITGHIGRLNDRKSYGLDYMITYEISEIECRLKWLVNPQDFMRRN